MIEGMCEVERIALDVKNSNEAECGQKEDDGDWIGALKERHGPWTSKPLVVLSLFDGIGGIWRALHLLAIPFIGYSCEVDIHAIEVVKAHHPNVKPLGDIRHLRKHHIKGTEVDLVVGGFPCQDLSCLGKKEGLHGEQSKLFFELLRVIHLFEPKWFLVENVSSMNWVEREEISKCLNCIPIEIDSKELTPSRRRRLYWTNIPHPKSLPRVSEHVSTALQSVLENAIALETKCSCILGSNLSRVGYLQVGQVLDIAQNAFRPLNITEVEKILGYPREYTNAIATTERTVADGEAGSMSTINSEESQYPTMQEKSLQKMQKLLMYKDRWKLLGNTFSVRVIAYLLSPLLSTAVQVENLESPIKPERVLEHECSVIEQGEVWALNAYKYPNWYGVILSRSGGWLRKNGKRKKLCIEVHFLELTRDYMIGESDNWNPSRGTGRYKLSTYIDEQDSWVSFSHRVDGYYKFQHCYFIFPMKNEVWAVFDSTEKRTATMFVFIVETSIDKSKLETGCSGNERFHAVCKVLQQTCESEIFRCTDKEMNSWDLSPFAFRTPYYFKDEAGLFKLEFNKSPRFSAESLESRLVKRNISNMEN